MCQSPLQVTADATTGPTHYHSSNSTTAQPTIMLLPVATQHTAALCRNQQPSRFMFVVQYCRLQYLSCLQLMQFNTAACSISAAYSLMQFSTATCSISAAYSLMYFNTTAYSNSAAYSLMQFNTAACSSRLRLNVVQHCRLQYLSCLRLNVVQHRRLQQSPTA